MIVYTICLCFKMLCSNDDLSRVFIVGIFRFLATRLMLSAQYLFVEKDRTAVTLSQKQIARENDAYLVGFALHMVVQLVLQILFPKMFVSPNSGMPQAATLTMLVHVLIVEPLYYVAHRWLHLPTQFKNMHKFHHASVKTLTSTSLVQDFHEHIIYVAVFGPAIFVPYFVLGFNHWVAIAGYLLIFDALNAFGHSNIRCSHWAFKNAWSPLRYMIYTPEFHLGHHAYYNCNYALFMPVWDHLFGTYRAYALQPAAEKAALPPTSRQDFVFIGHNAGLGHYATIPEYCFYHIYNSFSLSWLPHELDLLLAHGLNQLLRCSFTSYGLTRYFVDGELAARVICIMRTPLDYMCPSCHAAINAEILALIREQHRRFSTRCFGLGGLNKMKQLNDGGALLAQMIRECPELCDKGIRLWTGDTLMVGSVVEQLLALPDLQSVCYVGAGGKIGTAVCQLLARQGIKVCIFSEYAAHPAGPPRRFERYARISYTSELSTLAAHKYVLIGTTLSRALRTKIERLALTQTHSQYFLDYSVPFMSMALQLPPPQRAVPASAPAQASVPAVRNLHLQIGVLQVTGDSFLRGYYDMCMGLDQGLIYPCHAGCLLHLALRRETDETGAVILEDVKPLWIVANSCGMDNRALKL